MPQPLYFKMIVIRIITALALIYYFMVFAGEIYTVEEISYLYKMLVIIVFYTAIDYKSTMRKLKALKTFNVSLNVWGAIPCFLSFPYTFEKIGNTIMYNPEMSRAEFIFVYLLVFIFSTFHFTLVVNEAKMEQKE